jgi:hypothetical protein
MVGRLVPHETRKTVRKYAVRARITRGGTIASPGGWLNQHGAVGWRVHSGGARPGDRHRPMPTTSADGRVSIVSISLVKWTHSLSMRARGLKSGLARMPWMRRRCMPILPPS